MHSKLPAMLRIERRIDIRSFHKLHAFMKRVNKGFEAKKSYIFSEEDLRKFFLEANDDNFLFLKVLVVITNAVIRCYVT